MAHQLTPVPVGAAVAGGGEITTSGEPRFLGPTTVRKRGLRMALRRNWQLYTLAVLPITHLILFAYVPMFGAIIAFRRFRPGGSLIGDEWVGLHFFRLAFSTPDFWSAFWNTVILGGLWFVIGFPLPIILALLLNEVRARKFKRTVQTITYLPHFMSIVIVSGLVLQLVSRDGAFNQMLGWFGAEPVIWMQQPEAFRPIWIISEAWQTVGWGTILYLAALTTVDDQLYEAARIDGANRWQQTWHVTLPGIRPTIVVLMVLNIGTFMGVGFEKVLLLQNPLINSTADVLSTYLFRIGIAGGQFSFATAIGLMQSVIGLILIVSANFVSRKLVGSSLW
ncbi:binding-protein-dependent transport systems inner membrane component [Xylanimonas cellulosilytica DSM 15894]|uniref:Binding-protein-dependent transport systems inner membrane component n=1 Tax=Xylanimonas cellulosilytica (strain DSM 15894 / JCM 12276 / CECT 5975 / KCTC 9989 / LMG 20990 / NBRC 107835 / XIL07) TaxID=446471 RepID=D1BXN3_XYLCX|nr:binding-protein-dependent transport systems inner membrane component [Xylanimonas cellulosilytica DSM 15894]